MSNLRTRVRRRHKERQLPPPRMGAFVIEYLKRSVTIAHLCRQLQQLHEPRVVINDVIALTLHVLAPSEGQAERIVQPYHALIVPSCDYIQDEELAALSKLACVTISLRRLAPLLRLSLPRVLQLGNTLASLPGVRVVPALHEWSVLRTCGLPSAALQLTDRELSLLEFCSRRGRRVREILRRHSGTSDDREQAHKELFRVIVRHVECGNLIIMRETALLISGGPLARHTKPGKTQLWPSILAQPRQVRWHDFVSTVRKEDDEDEDDEEEEEDDEEEEEDDEEEGEKQHKAEDVENENVRAQRPVSDLDLHADDNRVSIDGDVPVLSEAEFHLLKSLVPMLDGDTGTEEMAQQLRVPVRRVCALLSRVDGYVLVRVLADHQCHTDGYRLS
ncbi:MAG: hypothetical protein MHM6MM_008839 [Cercozoa sp. M6MM]